jgi:heme exporter protein C
MHHWFTLSRFRLISRYLMPLGLIMLLIGLGAGLYLGLITSPADYQQGDAVRIMYVHVPAAWMGLGLYLFVALAGASFLIWKNPLSGIIAQSAAPIGALFTLICLITGSIWGKPIWGAWWVWDARLTSMLVLFFFYVGLMVLADAYDSAERSMKATALLALVGVVNVPIVKFSVEWWHTLHQPASILRTGGIAIDPAMLQPLLLMYLGYMGYTIVVLLLKVHTTLGAKKLARMQEDIL